jgi:acetyltransferase-like isoleucine patch superfamily enzyme
VAGPAFTRRVKHALRPVGRPIKLLVHRLALERLRWVFFLDGIDGIQAALRRLPRDHATVLRRYGASVAESAVVIGPLSIVNAVGDFSNLQIGPGAHIGSEVFLDLVEPVRVEENATLSMRSCIVTHFDVGRASVSVESRRATGGVTIGAGAYVGLGAVILHGVRVGRGALVAAGAVVREDVADETMVGGVPARELTTRA